MDIYEVNVTALTHIIKFNALNYFYNFDRVTIKVLALVLSV